MCWNVHVYEMTMYICANVSYLPVLCSYCGVRDPSWAELRHFVWFLDRQLESCEKSVFCDETIFGDVMASLKTFVVKFMIQMSRVSFTQFCILLSSHHTLSLFFSLLSCALIFTISKGCVFVLLGLCYFIIEGRSGSRE